MDKRTVPKVVGKKIEEARKILKEDNIEIEKEKKKIDIFEHSGNVLKVEPEEGTKLKKQDKVILYVSNRKPILVIFLLFLICVLFGNSTLGEITIKGIEDKTIRVLNLSKPTAPEITGGSKEWALSRVIKVKKDSYAKKGLDYYEYCITGNKNLKKCKWKKTSTKNVKISETGKYYVVFRGVDKAGKTSSNSNIEIAYIDNNNPVINKVSIKNKKVVIEANDKESGIDKYYYSLDGENYKKTKKKFEIKDDVKEIYIKVVDKVGNKVISVIPVENGKTNDEPTTTTKVTETTTKKQDNNGNTNTSTTTTKIPNEKTTKSTSTATTTTKTTSTTTKKGFEYDIPKINLDKVPVEFVYGSDYELPSYVDFGNDEGTYKCVVEGKEETTTKNMAIGKHLIVCEATSKHNKRTMVEKEVEVKVKSGEEEIWDGWIRLNLNYPDNSTNWEWRIGKEGEIRDGYENTGWQDYTGPILVKLDDVKDVYIRYDLLGETYVIAPNGRVAVDIEPTSYALEGNNRTDVKIFYDKMAEVKEYRVAGEEWQEYTEPFKVGKNTLIEARGIRNEKVYDSDGNYLYTKKVTGADSVFIGEANAINGGTSNGGNKDSYEYEVVERTDGTSTTKPKNDTLPSTYLDGPEIKVNPTNELVESVKVSVIPQEPARKIYIMFGYGIYQEYTGEITVSKNTLVRAYYVRDSDGKSSEVTSYYIQNIKSKNKPYVRIDATPDYLSKKVNEVKVSISGSNYTKLEYSLDGVIYQNYTGEITVTRSTTIYAKGTNEYGETIEELNVTTINTPIEKDNINISIDISPKKEDIKGLVNKAKVKITYENKATKKYYKLGFYEEWKEYTGEFEITDNVTIYAYATGENAVGNGRKSVEYLTTGIANPIISVEPTGKSQQVKVSIEYANTAEITRYKIGNQEYRDYNGSFYVYENETIYAYNKDELGNEGTSEYTVKNIIGNPNYIVIDKGKYYIIKLNYPETSSVREYKWKSDGVWKEYNGYGILLIKNEYKNEYTNIKDGIKVEDEYGKEIIFTDHYYFIDVPFSELMENLFMRWDTTKINAPTIIETPEETTREASISIVYNKALVKKLYKIVYEDGEETEWLTYEKPFTINKNKATIFAKGITRGENESKVGSKTITNIDDTDPEIKVKGNFEKPSRQINVTVNAIDEFGIDKVKWVKGEQTKEYFKKNGNGIRNGSSFKVEENGKYTIHAVDYVGNEVIKVIEITNIDKDAPNIRINILTETFGTEAEIEIDYGDSVNKQYKIGKNGTYKEYTENLVIKSNDVLDLANEDGSLTIYAKGKDEAGNEGEVSENLYILDLDAPAVPEITAGAGYPILTEYGVKLGSKSYIKFDDRDDITNYYSTDDGTSWKIYTGPFEITSGTIKARSVKNNSGLVIETTKEVDIPEDALEPEAYDGDNNTTVVSGYLNVSSNMWNKKVEIVDAEAQYGTKEKIEFLDKNDNILLSKSGINKSQIIEIPENTYRIKFTGGGGGDYKARIREVNTYNQPELNINNYYPTITEYGVEAGYNEVTISYFPTSVQRLYRINDGEWKEYQDKTIRLELNDKIEAKGIDKNGIDTNVILYVSELVKDALGPEAYDGDNNTTSMSGFLNVSSNMWNKYINVIDAEAQYGTKEKIEFLDKNDNILLSKSGINKSQIIEIPENTYRIKFTGGGGGDYKARIREVNTYNQPELNINNYYPTITEYGVEAGYNEVTISYFPTSVQRLYRINDGEWKEYQDKTIRLELNDKIEAKGIDKNNIETEVTNYTAELPSDALGPAVYDGDTSTSVSWSGHSVLKKLKVSNEMMNKSYCLTATWTYQFTSYNGYIRYIDGSGNKISEISTGSNVYNFKYNNTKFTIPDGTAYIYFINGSNTGSYYTTNIYEISPDNTPIINETKYYSVVSALETRLSYSEISILYLSHLTNKQYSLDNGTTWLDYTKPFEAAIGTKVLAKAIDSDGTETEVSNYTVVGLSDNISKEVFDNDKSTSTSITKNTTKSFSLNNVAGRTLRIYTTGTVASNSYIKLFDARKKELANVSLSSNITTLVIPEGSVKASIYSGTSTLTINEVNLREIKTTKEKYPEITINDTNWTTTKTIEILYPEGTEREYSLDLGTTWNKYTNELTIDKETTIFARSIKDGKIISTNSYVITKVDNVKPTAELDIPEKILFGSDYKLPTTYTTGKSGGTSICKINNETVDNTKELQIGSFLIECSVVSGSGLTTNVSKTINIVSQMKLNEVILTQNEIVTSLPTLTTSSNNSNDSNGLYVSNSTNTGNNTYFFRGAVDNNNITFAGMNWKIIRINEDESIRIILDSPIDTSKVYTYNSSQSKDNMYYAESDVKPIIDNWYHDNLLNYDSKIAASQFCSEIHAIWDNTWSSDKGSVYNNYSPTFKCNDAMYTYNLKIGLINYDEAVYAGAYYGKQNTDYYLYTGYQYWTMSTAGYYDSDYGSATWVIGTSGTFGWIYFYAKNSNVIRPVINLSKEVIVDGQGTVDNPYVVK